MPNIEDKNPAMSDKQIILSALGWKVARYGESSSGCTLINPEGYYWPLGINPTLYRIESAAWNSVELDLNFCGANILPFMEKREFNFRVEVFCGEGGLCRAIFYRGTQDYAATESTVEAAIQEAFLSYCKEQEG